MGCEDANGAAAEALRRLLVGCPSFDVTNLRVSHGFTISQQISADFVVKVRAFG